MPTKTSNFSLNKPLENDPIDEDLWGGQLNTNMDTIDKRLTPTGCIQMYAGTTAPNSDWLLCDGSGVSRSTYADLFALVGTTFGSSDTASFKVPDLRGRTGIGLDNLGGTSANRITDTDADTLSGSGGSESQTPSGTVGTSGSTTLTESQIPSHSHNLQSDTGELLSNNNADGAAIGTRSVNITNTSNQPILTTTNTGGGAGHTHSGGTFSGSSMNVTQPWLALGAIIKT